MLARRRDSSQWNESKNLRDSNERTRTSTRVTGSILRNFSERLLTTLFIEFTWNYGYSEVISICKFALSRRLLLLWKKEHCR